MTVPTGQGLALDQLRSKRNEAEQVMVRAIKDRGSVVFESLAALASAADHTGQDRVVVFHGILVPNPDSSGVDCPGCGEQHLEMREVLDSVVVASGERQSVMSPSSDNTELWAEFVDVWQALRAVGTYSCLSPIPPGIVVDLDKHGLAGFVPIYCPFYGNGPGIVWLAGNSDTEELSEDPFEKILRDAEQSESTASSMTEWESRINMLARKYRIALPTRPHGDDGCPRCIDPDDLEEYDDEDDDEDDEDD